MIIKTTEEIKRIRYGGQGTQGNQEWICLDDLKYLIKERRNLYWNKCNENHGNEMCSCADIIFELNKIEDLCSSEQKEGVE